MYWYQKSPGDRALKRIGHMYHSSIEHEESFKEHFKITGDMSGSTAKNGSLLILDLKAPEHSAVYYCAASYAHWLQIASPSYKNSNRFNLDPEQAPPSSCSWFEAIISASHFTMRLFHLHDPFLSCSNLSQLMRGISWISITQGDSQVDLISDPSSETPKTLRCIVWTCFLSHLVLFWGSQHDLFALFLFPVR